MPPDIADPAPQASPVAAQVPESWRVPLIALAGSWATLILLFRQDWAKMADQWWNISTYTHVLLIPPIIGWLVWQCRAELSRFSPSGWLPGLGLFATSLLLWLLGDLAGLNIVRQTAAVSMLVSATLALLGPMIGRALAFPLFYMLFLVPFGDELVPLLQLVTAKLTIALVQVTGVKATIDGVFINTPAGLFEVAEACSGVKFLIAMIAFGVLACHVCFKGWTRRVTFMVLCVVAPILANGVRAWGTVFIAQHIGADAAGGFDHIVYGWFFFALVIAMVIGIGWRFFDRDAGAPLVDFGAISGSRVLTVSAERRVATRPLLLAMAVIVLGGLTWAAAAERLSARLPNQIFLPEVPGWIREDYRPLVWWEPRASGAAHRLLGRYADAQGHKVDVFFALYSAQSEGSKASGFGEGALTPGSPWQWLAPGPEVALAKSDRLLSKNQIERLALTSYREGDLLTGSSLSLRLATLRNRLLLRSEPTMLLILSAEKSGKNNPPEALAAFRQSTGALDRWMDRIAAAR